MIQFFALVLDLEFAAVDSMQCKDPSNWKSCTFKQSFQRTPPKIENVIQINSWIYFFQEKRDWVEVLGPEKNLTGTQ